MTATTNIVTETTTYVAGNSPITHLLENENEYGIADCMHMDKFRKENYDPTIQEKVDREHQAAAMQMDPMTTARHVLVFETKDTQEQVEFKVQNETQHVRMKNKKVKVDPTMIHKYKHNFDESEF